MTDILYTSVQRSTSATNKKDKLNNRSLNQQPNTASTVSDQVFCTSIRILPPSSLHIKVTQCVTLEGEPSNCPPAAMLKTWWGGSSHVVRRHLLSDEAAQAFQILAVQFNVIVSRSLHPQRLHRLGAALEQSQAVGEVDHLVLCAVDNEYGGSDFRYFLDAEKEGKTSVES